MKLYQTFLTLSILTFTATASAAEFKPGYILCERADVIAKYGKDAAGKKQYYRDNRWAKEKVLLLRGETGIWAGALALSSTRIPSGLKGPKLHEIRAKIGFTRSTGRMNWELSKVEEMKVLGGRPNVKAFGSAEGDMDGTLAEGATAVMNFSISDIGVERKPLTCVFHASADSAKAGQEEEELL